MTSPGPQKQKPIAVLLLAADASRATVLHAQLSMVLPHAVVTTADEATLTEGALPQADVAVVDAGAVEHRPRADSLRLLRARGFVGPVLVITVSPDESSVQTDAQSLGAVFISRAAADRTPTELGAAIVAVLDGDSTAAAQLAYARRVFAAGQMALSLQHSINNPLAALLAEAQLLQLEDMTSEQRASVDRMVELCRRIVALVRRLDALAG